MSNTNDFTHAWLMDVMAQGMYADILEFHAHLDQPKIPSTPSLLDETRYDFRFGHLKEELAEMDAAQSLSDLPEVVDGLVDLVYIAIGMLIEMGVNPIPPFTKVQQTNMAKKPGMTSRGEAKDAIKPEGWKPPDVEGVLREMALRAAVPLPMLEATAVMIERGRRYNSSTVSRREHFPLGIISIFQILWLKTLRLRVNVESGEKIDRDHLIDLINYAAFGVEIIDE